jgi:hypothetical protein
VLKSDQYFKPDIASILNAWTVLIFAHTLLL